MVRYVLVVVNPTTCKDMHIRSHTILLHPGASIVTSTNTTYYLRAMKSCIRYACSVHVTSLSQCMQRASGDNQGRAGQLSKRAHATCCKVVMRVNAFEC
jgi:hypothetical protein